VARVRDDLTALSGYHSPQVDVEVRLNTNEAPVAPADDVVRAMLNRIAELELNRYPDRQASELRRLLGLRHGLDPSMLHVGNGSNEVLQHILLAFGGRERTAITFGPTYQMHSQIAAITGTSVVDLGRGGDGRIDPGLLRQDQDRDIVFITSPNNPTGLAESHDTVRRSIVPWCAEADAVLVIDEAYVEFAPGDLLGLIDEYPSVIVTRTFSKTLALAGLRLGYAIAAPEVISALEIVTLPYHLSAVTQAAGIAALEQMGDVDTRVAELVAGREQIMSALRSHGVSVYESSANFVLFTPGPDRGNALWDALVMRGVLVRNCSSWPGLADHLRVTVGTPTENQRFISAVGEALEDIA